MAGIPKFKSGEPYGTGYGGDSPARYFQGGYAFDGSMRCIGTVDPASNQVVALPGNLRGPAPDPDPGTDVETPDRVSRLEQQVGALIEQNASLMALLQQQATNPPPAPPAPAGKPAAKAAKPAPADEAPSGDPLEDGPPEQKPEFIDPDQKGRKWFETVNEIKKWTGETPEDKMDALRILKRHGMLPPDDAGDGGDGDED